MPMLYINNLKRHSSSSVNGIHVKMCIRDRLKMKLGISTAFIAVFFFVIRCLEQNFRYWLPFLVGALVTNGIWNYFLYKREYGNYLSISRYLNAFEEGDYDFHTEEDYMKSGIHSQITEHLERLGSAFGTLRNPVSYTHLDVYKRQV